MAYQVVKKWANWDTEKSEVVVKGLYSYEAAVSEAKARFTAQPLPWAAYVVEDDKAGMEDSTEGM